jgi:hypothetical protein
MTAPTECRTVGYRRAVFPDRRESNALNPSPCPDIAARKSRIERASASFSASC